MTVLHPAFLLFTLIPVAWAAWLWRSTPNKRSLILKALSLVAIALALAEPRFNFNGTKVAVAVLVDNSASTSAQDLKNANALLNSLEKARGSNSLQVIDFARTATPAIRAASGRWELTAGSGDAARATNLETAIRDAVAQLPAGELHRVALISDGHENAGTVTRATWQAQQLGIPIDTFAMVGRPKPNLRTEAVSFPSEVFSGEHFPIDLTVTSPAASAATIEISAEGKKLGTSNVQLQAGENHLRVRSSLMATGAVDVAGVLHTESLGDARFEQAVTVRRPRVLVFSQDPVGSEDHLTHALAANQFDWKLTSEALPAKLDDYQMLVFNNWDMEAISAADKTRIEKFEQQGGGLLWIAGEKNQYVEKKPGTPEDPLERAFPAKLAPPRSPEGTCVVLIIDKSSSMEGKKMELARAASIGVVENLRPIDSVGVLIFDNSFQWAVPIRKAEDRTLIKRLIAGITPDGGTQIAPALAESFHKIMAVQAVYKHIVLLTDGISEEGDSMTLSREAAATKVTISTVGLGQDVNRAYLEKIASFSKGKSYFLNDPTGLEQILLKDVQEHTGTTAVEKAIHATVLQKAELLEGVGMETAPALQGYVRFEQKPSAAELLEIDVANLGKKDPLFVRWQYGLGRSAVFTSDAKSRWASEWVGWPGFDKFWANVFRDLLPHATATEAVSSYDVASGDLIVNYHLGRNVPEPAKAPDVFALGPNKFAKPMTVVKLAPGTYRATVPIGTTQGLFRIRPALDSRAFPEVGFYREEAELREYGSNALLLKQIAESTGGAFHSTVADSGDLFQSNGRFVPTMLQLWPGLLALALLLNLAELILRKWKGLLESFRRAKPAMALLLIVSPSALENKFVQIEHETVRPGTRVVMPAAEWNEWVRTQVPPGVHNPRITLSNGRVTASANVDFNEVQHAAGQPPNWFVQNLLRGVHPVSATARIQSGDGKGRVDVERAEINGFVVQGKVVEWLVENYVRPKHPDAQIGTWFGFVHGIDHLEITPVAVTIVIGGDLVELTQRTDIRYATAHNFMGRPMYKTGHAYMQTEAADALKLVEQSLRAKGLGLMVFDAYRPWSVTKAFWDATPPAKRQFVADPAQGSKHNRGCAVDLTLYNLRTKRPLPMPGEYDEMTERSYPTYKGGTAEERANRDLLRRSMEQQGFTVNESEWWHFDYKTWPTHPVTNWSWF